MIFRILTCLFSETSCTTPHHLQKLHITENSSILLEFRVYVHSRYVLDINARIYDTESIRGNLFSQITNTISVYLFYSVAFYMCVVELRN